MTNPKRRIGYKDINELKNHSWFNDIDWIKLERKEIKSPFHFIKFSDNYSYCSHHKFSNNSIKRYRKASKTILYKEMIKNFDYSNFSILKLNYS